MFKLEIDTGNAAFDDCETVEVARILRDLAEDLESFAWHGGSSKFTLRDINGNRVGIAEFIED